MVKAITARRQGDEYQARIFWFNLLELRTGDYIESVCLESDLVSFVDDVVVKYREPIIERSTGNRIECDFLQCKYHVTQGGSFTYEKIIDPKYTGTKESLLKRLYQAYELLSTQFSEFRLYIVSNWTWHPDDELSKHLSEERIRSTFYESGKRSIAGMIRSVFVEHLSISDDALRSFLDKVRFRLGKNLSDLVYELQPRIKLAGLRPIDPKSSNIIYDDLAWKLFAQGHNFFDSKSFNRMLHKENLIEIPPPEYSEISIKSFPQFARRPRDFQSAHLDLTDLFKGRFPQCPTYWGKDIPNRVASFLQSDMLKNLPQPIHLFFDCHLSIAFLTGYLLNPKFGIQIVPAHKSRSRGYEFWNEPKTSSSGLWNINTSGEINTEVIVAVSVTNPIKTHLQDFLRSNKLENLPQISVCPVNGIGPNVVYDGSHAWQLGFELQTLIRERIPTTCHTLHLFFSVPVTLAYILGNTLRYVAQIIQLYEHDFEGLTLPTRYYPSIRLPMDD